MAKLLKLTKFTIDSNWVDNEYVNKELLTVAYVNPTNIQIVQVTSCFLPGTKETEDSYIDKVMITFGNEQDLTVNESLDEVIAMLESFDDKY